MHIYDFITFQVMDELCLQHWVLRQHGMETASATVILAATADGNLLPPFLVTILNPLS